MSRSVDGREDPPGSVRRGGLKARPRPDGLGNGFAQVMIVPPADTSGATVTGREGRGHDGTRHAPMGAGPWVADSWDAWMQAPRGEPPGQESSRDPGLDGLAGRQDSDDPDAAARGSVRL